MTRVPAALSFGTVRPTACPIGRLSCVDGMDRRCEFINGEREHGRGKTIILCSAPTKMTKGNETK